MKNKTNLLKQLYKKAYLIRASEQIIIDNYSSDEMKTPMHMSMGAEAIAAGVCQALGKENQAYGTYRSHGLYLAKTEETDQFFAEMYGKESGVIKGKGGSMHLLSLENNLLGVSAIVASTIPLAVGSAFANVYNKQNKVVAVFFGDGAIDEGVFWESMNIACLFKLPVLFVCEDNDLAVHTEGQLRHGYKSIDEIISKFDCDVYKSDSTDAEVIYDLSKKVIEKIYKNKKPAFLHLKYYRYLEHVGVFEDFNAGYRDRAVFEDWLKKDPIKVLRKKLIKNGITEGEVEKIEQNIKINVQNSLNKAQQDKFPSKKELMKNIFYDEN